MGSAMRVDINWVIGLVVLVILIVLLIRLI